MHKHKLARTAAGGLGQGVGVAENNIEQLGEAAQNVAVMCGSEHGRECWCNAYSRMLKCDHDEGLTSDIV